MISILLTTYNRTDDCIKCLNVLKPQITDNIELILLDDWHIKSDILEQYCTENNFIYLHTGIQKNGQVKWRVPGFAYNIGAKVAKGDYFIIGGAEMLHLNDNTIKQMYIPNTATSPIILDEVSKNSKKYNILNNKFPFCFGVPKNIYYEIGGYDEDFIGYSYEDADFSDRVLSLIPFKEIKAEVIHLWNPRGIQNRGDRKINQKAYNLNINLYKSRKDILIRNIGKNWGKL